MFRINFGLLFIAGMSGRQRARAAASAAHVLYRARISRYSQTQPLSFKLRLELNNVCVC